MPEDSKPEPKPKPQTKRKRRKQGPFILGYKNLPGNQNWDFVALPNDIRELRTAEKWIKDKYNDLYDLSEEFLLCRVVGNVKIEQITTTNVNIEAEE